ncbi:hypothetical protein [Rhizobium sp. BK176]|uniref:hypothetical protein n=1 Tax=Rhizobium sp. BK176 TaxID=2587071 RepID=UPI002168A3CA|nr:hypothetical protein [Rhizobium sp. BK176]MCS4089170.1 hypothetical protein [Rhizobium sp. BK176]
MNDRPLNRKMLEKAFNKLGEILARKKVLGEIAVYGGTAVMLQLEYRENTADVDCVVSVGHGPVMEAAREVGRQLGIGTSWLNENVSVFTSRSATDADLIPYGKYPQHGRPHLNVVLAKPDYLVAMKVEALRRAASRDISDLTMLAKKLGLKTADDIFSIHALYFGPENINLTMKQAVAGIAADLTNGPEDDVGNSPKKPS